jgi:site-specific DNA recombinase
LASFGELNNIVTLRSTILKRYREYVENIGIFLGSCSIRAQGHAAKAVRELIETVTVWHGGAHGRVKVQTEGRLATLFGPDTVPSNVWGTVERVMGIEPTS